MFSGRLIINCIRNTASKQLILHNQNANRYYKRWLAPTLHEMKRRKDRMGPEPVIRRATFIEWNLDAEIYAFGKRLREEFDSDLLKQAFTHRSYILQEELRQREAGIDSPQINLADNKELIKLGEKFISSTVKNYLSKHFPDYPETGQQAIHDYLVSDETLADISQNLGTKDIILSAEFPPEKLTHALTLRAIIGALLKSSDETRTREFIKDFIVSYLNGKDINSIWKIDNPMQLLSEKLKELNMAEPEARIVSEAGKNTILAVYQAGIYSNKKLIAIGTGQNVSEAIDIAARESLKKLFKTEDNMRPLALNVPNFKFIKNQLQ